MSAKEAGAPTRSRLGRPPRGTEGEVTLRILAAAKPVFMKEGFESANIDVIAASAGMSKKTIYTRFASKDDLFEAVIVALIEQNMPRVERAASEAGPVVERLHRLALAVLEVALSAECIVMRRIIVAEAVRFPEFAHLYNDFGTARIAPLVERCLEDGTASGEIAVDDVRQATSFFLGLSVRSFIDRAELGLERPGLSHVKRETLRHAVDFFMKACRRG